MGVKDLWNILSPLCEKKPLYELQGKTIAIDLSGWVVDSQTIVDHSVQPKMYLRNLYFRTAFLLMQGISPVFVLEGKAPDLKHKTIARRNDIRNGFRERKTAKKGGRTQFNRILNECKTLLKYMGIACVQGHGEAEAMCAYLNEDGLVDGCISQDSDCFLYGAKMVYRNFCASTQGNSGATGFVDVYSMEKIEKTLNIGRNKMIVLALLCGCDYNHGVKGIGKEAALKFFKTISDEEVLQRIQQWRTDTNLNRVELDLLNTDICRSCGHRGKLLKHTKSGCVECGTARKCNDDFREKRALILNEVSLRKKALCDADFPNQELIEEFLRRKDPVPSRLDIEWKQPDVNQFIDFMRKYLCWEPQYAFEKIFTLTTRWQLLHLPNLTLNERLSTPDLFFPDEIKKIRNIRCVASYEIIWKKEHSVITMLKKHKEQTQENDDDNIDEDIDNSLLTIEPQNLVLKCYPQLVEAFESIRNAKAKKRTANSRKKKIATDTTDNNTVVKDISKLKVRQKKTGKKAEKNKNNKKIDEFVSKNCVESLDESFEKMAITPKRSKRENRLNKPSELKIKDTHENNTIVNIKQVKRGPQFSRVLETERMHSKLNNTIDRIFNELTPDDFMSENEDDDLDVTSVIEDICNKRTFEFNVKNWRPMKSTNQHMEGYTKIDKSETSLDIGTHAKLDELETSMLDTGKHEEINELETLTLNIEKHDEIETKKSDDLGDEFDDIDELYIPINQRLQIEESKRSSQSTCNLGEKKSCFDFEDIMNETNNENMQLGK